MLQSQISTSHTIRSKKTKKYLIVDGHAAHQPKKSENVTRATKPQKQIPITTEEFKVVERIQRD